ncbi:MAG: hypothetical protein ACYST9_03125 [Planctomycetota bacterium]
MKKVLTILIVLAFSLPCYSEVLVYKYSDQIDFFDLTEIIESNDTNYPDIYNWDVLIKSRLKGYLVVNVDYNDLSIDNAVLIAYWRNSKSASQANPKGKFQETIEIENLELVKATEIKNKNRKYYRWVFVDTQNLEDSPGILMLSGKARIQDIGLQPGQKREIAKSMKGYVLGDSTKAGEQTGELRMGKVAARFDKKWTKIANLDPNKGGFGGDFDGFVNAIEAKSLKGYLKKKGYFSPGRGAGTLDAPQWVDVNYTDTNDVFLDWTDVSGARKYSVDIKGTATYFDPDSQTSREIDVELSIGTSDRKDGGSMGDSDLIVSISELDYAVVYALFDHGVDPIIIRDLDSWQFIGTAKVKGLNPGKGNGRQNHPFSQWSDNFEVTWNADE